MERRVRAEICFRNCFRTSVMLQVDNIAASYDGLRALNGVLLEVVAGLTAPRTDPYERHYRTAPTLDVWREASIHFAHATKPLGHGFPRSVSGSCRVAQRSPWSALSPPPPPGPRTTRPVQSAARPHQSRLRERTVSRKIFRFFSASATRSPLGAAVSKTHQPVYPIS